MITSQCVPAIARPTNTTFLAGERIFLSKLMPVLAMGFLGIKKGVANTKVWLSTIVYRMCDSIQVIRIDTYPIPTQMIYLQTDWNLSVKEFPCKPMGSPRLGSRIKLPITLLAHRPLPQPTGVSPENLLPESFFYRT